MELAEVEEVEDTLRDVAQQELVRKEGELLDTPGLVWQSVELVVRLLELLDA